jgi:hypothetical protein
MSSSSVSTRAPHTASRTLIASVMGARTPTKLGGKQVLRCETTLPQCGEEARMPGYRATTLVVLLQCMSPFLALC